MKPFDWRLGARTSPTAHAYFSNEIARLRRIGPSRNTDLTSIAHSRPALRIVPPAFFRHAMFFFPFEVGSKAHILHPGEFDRDGAVEALAKLLKDIVKSDQCSLTSSSSVRAIEKWKQDFENGTDRDFTFVLTLDSFLGFDFRVAVDVYSEYATVSFTLDNCSWPKDDALSTPDQIAVYIRGKISASRTIRSPDHFNEMRANELVYFGIWDLLSAEWNFKIEDTRIGSLFGDFRGFAICPKDTPAAESSNKQRRADLIPPSIRLGSDQDVEQFYHDHSTFFLSCLGLDENGIRNDEHKDERREPNIILCKMLDGDAIYGSALGNKDALARIEMAPTPSAYFFIYNGRSMDQLGRMVRRQHLLGELRLAALLDVETIMQLGGRIRILNGLVLKLLSYGTRYSTVGPNDYDEVVQLYIQIGKKCHGGLLYRLARATYYYEALHARMDDTRSHPIDGWQSYTAFIRRHFDQRFRSMRSTGSRYIDVGHRIERLLAIHAGERQRLAAMAPLTIAVTSFFLAVVSSILWPLEAKYGIVVAAIGAALIISCFLSLLFYLVKVVTPKGVDGLSERLQADDND